TGGHGGTGGTSGNGGNGGVGYGGGKGGNGSDGGIFGGAGGRGGHSFGGAIRAPSGQVSITQSTFVSNAATGGDGGTGGKGGTGGTGGGGTNGQPNGSNGGGGRGYTGGDAGYAFGGVLNTDQNTTTPNPSVANSTFTMNEAAGGSGGNGGKGGDGGAGVAPGGPGGSGGSDGSGGNGGALSAGQGLLKIYNVTISANHALGEPPSAGGAGGTGTPTGATGSPGSFGQASSGGGVYGVSLSNTIVANNTAPIGANCSGVQDSGGNLEWNPTGTCSGSFLNGDPKLGALGSYGGATQTLPLGSGSSATGNGDTSVCAAMPVDGMDQRGVARPVDVCSIGAYEGVGPPPTITTISPTTGPTTGGTQVTITGTNFVIGLTVKFGGYYGVAATIVSVTSTQIVLTTPAHAAGTVPIMVINPDTQTAFLANAFTYALNPNPLPPVQPTGVPIGPPIPLPPTRPTGVPITNATPLPQPPRRP
ncbi:MAG: IPT/TIG domain-containing protein, partial [Thermomicrobiales bacterium]